jgi:hypothetical protein
MYVSKRMRFDEIVTSSVSVHPSEQWFKEQILVNSRAPFYKNKSNLINLLFLVFHMCFLTLAQKDISFSSYHLKDKYVEIKHRKRMQLMSSALPS